MTKTALPNVKRGRNLRGTAAAVVVVVGAMSVEAVAYVDGDQIENDLAVWHTGMVRVM